VVLVARRPVRSLITPVLKIGIRRLDSALTNTISGGQTCWRKCLIYLSCAGNHRAKNAAAFSINSRKFVEINAR